MPEIKTASGLTADEQQDLRILAQVVQDEPGGVDALIRSYGLEPEPYPDEKAIQLILIGAMEPDVENFDTQIAEHIASQEFLGLGTVLKGIGKIFKRKEGGTKVGNFFRRIFKRRGRPDTGAGAASTAEAQRIMEEAQRKATEEETAAKQKKMKQRRLFMWIGGGVAFVAVVIIIIFLIRRSS